MNVHTCADQQKTRPRRQPTHMKFGLARTPFESLNPVKMATKIRMHMLSSALDLRKQNKSCPDSDLGRCGRTAGTMWQLLKYTDNWDELFKVGRPLKDMETSVTQMLVTPTADTFHVAAFALNGLNNHQLVVVFASDGMAYSVQSYIHLYGPEMKTLGKSTQVIATMLYLIQNEYGHWTQEYCDAYERLACLLSHDRSKKELDSGLAVYERSMRWSRDKPDALKFRTPQANIVVKLDQAFW